MKLFPIFSAVALAVILNGCAPKFEQPVRYMMNLHILEASGNDLKDAKEWKSQRFDICFTNSSGDPMCFENMSSGGFAEIRTNSPTIRLASIDLLGNPKYEYAFIKGQGPSITLKEYVPRAYMGSLLIYVSQEKKHGQPVLMLYCGCIEKVKREAMASLVKFKTLQPDDEVATHCMQIGAVIGNPKKSKESFSLLQGMPAKLTK